MSSTQRDWTGLTNDAGGLSSALEVATTSRVFACGTTARFDQDLCDAPLPCVAYELRTSAIRASVPDIDGEIATRHTLREDFCGRGSPPVAASREREARLIALPSTRPARRSSPSLRTAPTPVVSSARRFAQVLFSSLQPALRRHRPTRRDKELRACLRTVSRAAESPRLPRRTCPAATVPTRERRANRPRKQPRASVVGVALPRRPRDQHLHASGILRVTGEPRAAAPRRFAAI